ncbi:cell division protein ZapA [Yeguia hominis]|uniref:Cell division protein ZapA n=1 Tax=Yeguia hominis TaxID=2763662 RepID=A0A926D883_9FIRM|nr:cell division protein ZapA [Yeguia hominis]MBC8532649.1 cell division protein ZapA [Yeguia hominis]
MGKQKVKLNICGLDCVVATDEREEDVREAAKVVEQAINGIIEQNSRASITLAAIVTALSYYDDMRRAVQSADNLRSQIKNYLEDASRARLEADEARREIERMKKEIKVLRSRLSGGAVPNAENGDDAPSAPEAAAPAPMPSGNYVKPSLVDVLPEQESFVSFFEKKDE